MSTMVMGLCWPLQMPSTQKSVLVSLADNANDHGYCWPSVPTICERTCLGRTAVLNAISWLEAAGFIAIDRTDGCVNKYQLTPVREADQSAKRTSAPRELHQSAKRTTPVREADPNRKEPSENRNVGSAHELPEWLPADAWAEWRAWRGSRKGWTAHAEKLSLRSLTKLHAAGFNPREVIEQSIERGWTGLFKIRGDFDANSNSGRKLSVVERVARINAEAERAELDSRVVSSQ